MAAYHRVYDSHHLHADCQEPGSAPNSKLSNRVGAIFFTFLHNGVTTTTQSTVTEASLRIVWVLGRHYKSFTDAEVMSASSVLFSDKKCVELIQQLLLSDSTASHHVRFLLPLYRTIA